LIVFQCFLQKRINLTQAALIIQQMVQREGKKDNASLDECHFAYNQLTMIKIACLSWLCDELYIVTLFFYLTMHQSNAIDDAMNNAVMFIDHQQKQNCFYIIFILYIFIYRLY